MMTEMLRSVQGLYSFLFNFPTLAPIRGSDPPEPHRSLMLPSSTSATLAGLR